MGRFHRAALVVAMMASSAATTLAMAPVPVGSTSPETQAAEVATPAAVAPTLPSPSPTATPTAAILPTVTLPTQTPEPAATSPISTPAPVASATPPPLSWPSAADDDNGSDAPSPGDPALTPSDAWFSREASDLLRDGIDALLTDRAGSYSVVVTTADGHALYTRGGDDSYEAASLYKLAVMVEVFRQHQSGKLAFDDLVLIEPDYLAESPGDTLYLGQALPVDTLLHHMIAWSSNVAAWALLDVVGIGNVNRTLAGLGLRSTFIDLRPLPSVAELEDGNYMERPHVTSASDLALLYELLLAGKVVSPEASAEMLDLLARQGISNRLPAYLPWDAVVAHKTGNLPGMVHDAGVIYTPGGPVIVVALTEGVNEREAVDVIAHIGSLVYRFGESGAYGE